MATAQSGVRVFGEKRTIDYARTLGFFEARARNSKDNVVTATMYQDADLAARRDRTEKETVLPLFNVNAADRVLDVGCGAGRWAEVLAPKVTFYLGVDFSQGLLELARMRVPSAVFQCAPVSSLEPGRPFSLFICSGILTYLNDPDVLHVFRTISRTAARNSRIYIREPLAKIERLTLDEYWSEELQANYSAIYRTRVEYLELFPALAGFRLCNEGEPFPRELQNRADTEQRFFILEHRAAD